jgi:hypothetical protein
MKKSTIGLSIVLMAVFSLNLFARPPLTFEERVKAQEAIEKVYYNHRIWPKENPQPKPAFEKMVTKEQIEAKVTDYLKKCSALDQFWQRPIIASQLQAEMDRMAKGTKDPQTLNELFAALKNDPYLIAECLAKPVLADRLIHNWYANDERFHADTKAKAEEALKTLTPENFCQYTDAQYGNVNYKIGSKNDLDSLEATGAPNQVTTVSEEEFAGISSEIPEENTISDVQEKNDSFLLIHTIIKNEMEIEIERLTFEKQSLEEWIKNQNLLAALPTIGDSSVSLYIPPMTESACTEGWWDNGILANSPPVARGSHTAVWTGTEMIIWGGRNGQIFFNTGGKYNPSTDTWELTSTGTNCPAAREDHTAVWTGTEMIVWGGISPTYPYDPIIGGRYNPLTDSWQTTSTGANFPPGHRYHAAIWTGSEMIVWGGYYGGAGINTGGRYSPSIDSWTAVSTVDAPSGRWSHTAVWTGNEMIVWGGSPSLTNTGGRYSPYTDSWVSTSIGDNVPIGRSFHTAVWTGREMIVWGGWVSNSSPNLTNTGGKYEPLTDSWQATSTDANVPYARDYHHAIWTGSEMIIWGGTGITKTGGKYDPGTDSWVPTSTGANLPTGNSENTTVWTGSEMIAWGGGTSTGGRYNPLADSWVPTSIGGNVPSGRIYFTSVWTGTDLVVWGGQGGSTTFSNTGGVYCLATDSWVPTSVGANNPAARYSHGAVWTGSEMIIWGGRGQGGELNTGGRYNQDSNTWLPTSTSTNLPTARICRSAVVWTGTEMIVWGGYPYTNTGGRYNPATDSWQSTSTATNVPSPRFYHTAIWTGLEMIVWGGNDGTNDLNTGAKYDPPTNSWTPTSTGVNVPYKRMNHSTIWTGSNMIVWGGRYSTSSYLNSGGCYNPSSNSWLTTAGGTSLPSARENHTAVWTGKEMIVWGGGNSKYLSNGGRYDATTNTWQITSTGAWLPIARQRHLAVWTGENMLVWGGYDGSVYLNTGGIYYLPFSPSDFSANTATDINGCSDEGVLISWTAPSNWGDGGSGTRTFDVLRDGSAIANSLSESTLLYTDTAGENENSYLYQVRANNGCGLSTITTGIPAVDHISPSQPAVIVRDGNPCAQNGVYIDYIAGSPADRHDLYVDASLISTNIAPNYYYNPGDTAIHNYVVRAVNSVNLCYADSPETVASDVNDAPLVQPVITSIVDISRATWGLKITYSPGTPAQRHDLHKDGNPIVYGFASGSIYVGSDHNQHSYEIVAVNGGCSLASAPVTAVDQGLIIRPRPRVPIPDDPFPLK